MTGPEPWWRDTDEGGRGMGVLLAVAGIVLGVGALGIALFAPFAGDELRTVWTAGFGALAIWVSASAGPRFRRAGSAAARPLVVTGIVLGVAAMVVAVYAFIVIFAASGGVDLPAPGYWLPPERAPGGVDA